MSATSGEFEGMSVQVTELGAIIINSDGTMSKVENWKELTPAEQAKTLRVIAKRNAKRKAILQQQQENSTDTSESIAQNKQGEIFAIEN